MTKQSALSTKSTCDVEVLQQQQKTPKGEHQNRSHLCLHTSDICVLTQEFEKICTTLVNTTKSTIISLENRHTLSPSHYHDKERVRQRQTEEEKQ